MKLSLPLGELQHSPSRDYRLVAAMMKPLGYFDVGVTLPDGSISTGGDYYDCRLLDVNGDCLIYESRPQMCRLYPNNNGCTKPGCTRRDDASG